MLKREKSLSVFFLMHANQKLQSLSMQRSSLQICVVEGSWLETICFLSCYLHSSCVSFCQVVFISMGFSLPVVDAVSVCPVSTR